MHAEWCGVRERPLISFLHQRKTHQMILSQGILDELRHQAELQGKKNYRCIEVDWRTVIALCDETERWRKKIVPVGEPVPQKNDVAKFAPRDRVVFSGKEYEFGGYSDGSTCVLFEIGGCALEDSFSVLACNVRKAPF